MKHLSAKDSGSFSQLVGTFFGFCLIAVLFVFSIHQVAFDKSWYHDFYQKEDLAQNLGVSRKDLDLAIDVLIDYVDGSRNDLDEVIVRNGQQTILYNDREISHMADVRALWLKAKTISEQLLLLALILAFWIIVTKHPDALRGVFRAYGLLAIFVALAGIWIFVDFNGFWNLFHRLFFDNELWLLDPSTDFMILICPENMFFELILNILLWFGALSLVVLGICYWAAKKKK